MWTAQHIAHAEVWLFRPGQQPEHIADTDVEGKFGFSLSRAGDWNAGNLNVGAEHHPPLLEVRAEGYATYAVPRGSVRRNKFLRSELSLQGPLEESITYIVQLIPAYQLRGQVLDSAGQGAFAELFLINPLGEVDGEASIGETDEHGNFDLADVGKCHVGSPRALPLVAIGHGGTGFTCVKVQLPASLRSGEAPPAIEDIEISLNNLRARVRVVDEHGQGLAGVMLEAKPKSGLWNHFGWERVPQGRQLWLDELPETFAKRFRSTTGADGFASMEHLPSWDDPSSPKINGLPLIAWRIHATLPGYLPASVQVGVADTPILDQFQAQELVMKRPRAFLVSGRALGPTGEPLVRARIYNRDSMRETFSEEDGKWTWLVDDPGQFPIELHCDQPQLASAFCSIQLAEFDGAVQVRRDLRFESAVGAALRVIDNSGTPVSGIRIGFRREGAQKSSGLILARSTTGMDGWIRDPVLPDGWYTVHLGPSWPGDGTKITPFEIQLQAGEERVVSVDVLD